jgi:hypothetical protein
MARAMQPEKMLGPPQPRKHLLHLTATSTNNKKADFFFITKE